MVLRGLRIMGLGFRGSEGVRPVILDFGRFRMVGFIS